jgi:putative pyruvate formate lyase activating enzyme
MNLLKGVIDVYLTDFKYGCSQCAKRLSKVDNYFEIVSRNHTIAYKQGELIIRHLVLPNHVECCSKPILQWISQKMPNVAVNLMAQYRPEYHAYDYDDLIRSITYEEYSEVRQYAKDLNLVLI